MRDSIVFYRSFWEAIKQLPEKERLESLTAILEYGLDEIEPKSAGVASAMFLMAKPQIDANNRRYQNGTKGGRPTTKTKEEQEELKKDNLVHDGSNLELTKDNLDITKTNLELTSDKPNEKDNVKEKDNVNDNNKKTFTPPSVSDVSDYCNLNGYGIDPESFVDFYASKGWMVGKNKMKDWKASVRTWARSQRQELTAKGSKNQFHNFDQRDTDYDALMLKQVKDWVGEKQDEGNT